VRLGKAYKWQQSAQKRTACGLNGAAGFIVTFKTGSWT